VRADTVQVGSALKEAERENGDEVPLIVAVAELPLALPDAVTLPKSCKIGPKTAHDDPQAALLSRLTELLTKASGIVLAWANSGNVQPMQIPIMLKIVNRRRNAITPTIVFYDPRLMFTGAPRAAE
jgi:hypothetical protein